MKVEDIKVDYAPHYLEIESNLKIVHEMLKRGNYVEALSVVDEITVECRLLRTAIKSHVNN